MRGAKTATDCIAPDCKGLCGSTDSGPVPQVTLATAEGALAFARGGSAGEAEVQPRRLGGETRGEAAPHPSDAGCSPTEGGKHVGIRHSFSCLRCETWRTLLRARLEVDKGIVANSDRLTEVIV